MQFNSLNFAYFFVMVYILYLAVGHKWQNRLLLVASYAFYSFWDWRFLSLILLSTFVNYYAGIKIETAASSFQRKKILFASISYNLIVLGFFKYFNFFAYNLRVLCWSFGWQISPVMLNIVLPVGISFYTFQAMSYPIDVYRNVIKPTRKLLDFAVFIAFFPQLVAGPIERAKNLLPQISGKRIVTFEKFYAGAWLIFWGLFKKIVIADNLAKLTLPVFQAENPVSGINLLIVIYMFAFQVYADFSGYSNMARGLAKVLGIELMVNFKTPFFASNLYDFWQRWHISLTTWIKEYLFYPLALARFFRKQLRAPVVVLLSWSIMGFWHGASWKFVLWGVYHALLLILYSKIRPHLKFFRPGNDPLKLIFKILGIIFVFNLFSIGIVFFAAESLPQVGGIFLSTFSGIVSGVPLNIYYLFLFLAASLPVMALESFQYKHNDELVIFSWPFYVRGVIYFGILYAIILFGDFSAQKYYYFQF